VLVFLFLVEKTATGDVQVLVDVLDSELGQLALELPQTGFTSVDGFEGVQK
jgi:hypothetical protein